MQLPSIYPSNYFEMDPMDKIKWVKSLSPDQIKAALGKAGEAKTAVKQAVDTVVANKQAASATAPAAVAAAPAAKATLGAGISLGAPIAAGVLGALAIWRAKKKFDKEIDSYTTESNKRHAELMAAIKRKRDKNFPPKPVEKPKQDNKIKEMSTPSGPQLKRGLYNAGAGALGTPSSPSDLTVFFE